MLPNNLLTYTKSHTPISNICWMVFSIPNHGESLQECHRQWKAFRITQRYWERSKTMHVPSAIHHPWTLELSRVQELDDGMGGAKIYIILIAQKICNGFCTIAKSSSQSCTADQQRMYHLQCQSSFL